VPILRDFERRLGNLVEGFFATTFRSGLQPVELAKRVMREMDAGKTVGVRDVWSPNRFVFSLSEEDGNRYEQHDGRDVGVTVGQGRENPTPEAPEPVNDRLEDVEHFRFSFRQPRCHSQWP